MKVLVPLAPGFEEIEAVTIIDILRRGGVSVVTASLEDRYVTGSHDIIIKADIELSDINIEEFKSVVLPGGMPGSKNLKESDLLSKHIAKISEKNGILAAICAAPIVYGYQGYLKDKTATCFPGFEKELSGALYVEEPVVADGNIITGRGPGCAIPFALKLVEIFISKEKSQEIENAIQVYWM